MSYDDISFGYLEYLPPVVLVSLSFLKAFKCPEKMSPLLTEGSTDSDALNMSGLCRLFSTSTAYFLMFSQFMRMHRRFGLFFCLYVFFLLVVLLLVVLFEI